MTSVYINYPNPHFSIEHGVTSLSRIRHEKDDRRLVTFTPHTLSSALLPFINAEVQFGASQAVNDMWLDLDFGNQEFEIALVKYIQTLLGRRYRPLADAPWR